MKIYVTIRINTVFIIYVAIRINAGTCAPLGAMGDMVSGHLSLV
jgi:hypothetical protein